MSIEKETGIRVDALKGVVTSRSKLWAKESFKRCDNYALQED